MTLTAVEIHVSEARCATAGIDADRIGARLIDQPEIVATERVHVRVGNDDGAGGGNHRLDGVAALAQDPGTGLGREVMRRCRPCRHRRVLFEALCAVLLVLA